MRSTHAPDGRLIDCYGIPEGGKPSTSVTYIDTDGQEYFRYNQGYTTNRDPSAPTLVSIIERLRPIAQDLRVVVGDWRNLLRTNPESALYMLGDFIRAESLLNEIDCATNHL